MTQVGTLSIEDAFFPADEPFNEDAEFIAAQRYQDLKRVVAAASDAELHEYVKTIVAEISRRLDASFKAMVTERRL